MHSVFSTASSHHEWFILMIRRYGYLGLFGIIAAQDLGVPTIVPGTVLLIFAGYLASTHALNPVVCGLVATAGALTGASALFHVARLGGEAFMQRFGRIIHMDRSRRAHLEHVLWQWGLPMWILFRVIPGFRDLLAIVAGIGGMAYRKFALLTTIASLIWAYGFILVGMALGRHWGRAAGVVATGGTIAVLAIVVVVSVLLIASRAHVRRMALDDGQVAHGVASWYSDLASHMRIGRVMRAARGHAGMWRRSLAGHMAAAQGWRAVHRQRWTRHLNLAGRLRLAGVRGRRGSDADTDSRR